MTNDNFLNFLECYYACYEILIKLLLITINDNWYEMRMTNEIWIWTGNTFLTVNSKQVQLACEIILFVSYVGSTLHYDIRSLIKRNVVIGFPANSCKVHYRLTVYCGGLIEDRKNKREGKKANNMTNYLSMSSRLFFVFFFSEV